MNSIRKFDKDILFEEILEVIRFYQEAEVLDDVDLDYRIKSTICVKGNILILWGEYCAGSMKMVKY